MKYLDTFLLFLFVGQISHLKHCLIPIAKFLVPATPLADQLNSLNLIIY